MPVLPIQATGPTLFSPWWAYQGYGSPGYMSQPAFTTASDAGGSLIASLTNAAFTSNNLQFSGTLTTQVVRNDTSNPYENGTILSIPGADVHLYVGE